MENNIGNILLSLSASILQMPQDTRDIEGIFFSVHLKIIQRPRDRRKGKTTKYEYCL